MTGLYKWLRRVLLRAAMLCVIAYVLLCIGCASLQRKLIYFPPPVSEDQVNRDAAAEQLQRWTTPSGEPIGWKRLSAIQPAQGQVLFLHGNASCAFQCSHFADPIQQAAPLDFFAVEFPGYENIPGSPTEMSLDQAADEAFNLLDTNRPIYLLGESLGTGVATYLAGKHSNQVAGVILCAPFNRLVDVGQAHMRILPVALLLRDRFPSEDYLQTFQGPIAILVGGRDNVVPERFGRRLYDAYSGPKKLWEFPEGDHGTIMLQPPEFWERVFEFLRSNGKQL